jgi:hypothetical protein
MFETIVGLIVVGGALLAFMAYQRSRVSRGQVEPISADDPDMVAARVTANARLSEFLELYARYPTGCSVKLPITSSAGTLEWMVGDVVELTDTFVKVQLRGRPVTHRGAFQSLQTFPLREIADWHVTTPEGKYLGGFTQRVHFDRMRAAGTLTGALAEEAAKYE